MSDYQDWSESRCHVKHSADGASVTVIENQGGFMVLVFWRKRVFRNCHAFKTLSDARDEAERILRKMSEPVMVAMRKIMLKRLRDWWTRPSWEDYLCEHQTCVDAMTRVCMLTESRELERVEVMRLRRLLIGRGMTDEEIGAMNRDPDVMLWEQWGK